MSSPEGQPGEEVEHEACEVCRGVGHLGPATNSPPKDYGRACPACADGDDRD